MRFHISICIAAAFVIVCAACNKGADPAYNDRPVVTAYLVAGTHPVITISRQSGTTSGVVFSGDDLNKLVLSFRDDSTAYPLTCTDTGRYSSADMLVTAGKTYQLSFDYNGKTVTCSTTIPDKPDSFTASASSISIPKIDFSSMPGTGGFTMPAPIDLSWTNKDNSYYLILTENLESTHELIRDTLSFGSSRPAFSFRNEPSITSSARIDANQFQYFGKHRLILFKLLPDYAALYESVSNSSTSLTTAASNISNGFGIFTGINSDTLYIQVNKQ